MQRAAKTNKNHDQPMSTSELSELQATLHNSLPPRTSSPESHATFLESSCSSYQPAQAAAALLLSSTVQEGGLSQFSEAVKLFRGSNCFLVAAGAPNSVAVVSSFQAGNETAVDHLTMQLGKLLSEFATRMMMMFEVGVETGISFASSWYSSIAVQCPTLRFQLQGLGTLFSYVFYQLAATQKVFEQVIWKEKHGTLDTKERDTCHAASTVTPPPPAEVSEGDRPSRGSFPAKVVVAEVGRTTEMMVMLQQLNDKIDSLVQLRETMVKKDPGLEKFGKGVSSPLKQPRERAAHIEKRRHIIIDPESESKKNNSYQQGRSRIHTREVREDVAAMIPEQKETLEETHPDLYSSTAQHNAAQPTENDPTLVNATNPTANRGGTTILVTVSPAPPHNKNEVAKLTTARTSREHAEMNLMHPKNVKSGMSLVSNMIPSAPCAAVVKSQYPLRRIGIAFNTPLFTQQPPAAAENHHPPDHCPRNEQRRRSLQKSLLVEKHVPPAAEETSPTRRDSSTVTCTTEMDCYMNRNGMGRRSKNGTVLNNTNKELLLDSDTNKTFTMQTWQEYWAGVEQEKLRKRLGVPFLVDYAHDDVQKYAAYLATLRQ